MGQLRRSIILDQMQVWSKVTIEFLPSFFPLSFSFLSFPLSLLLSFRFFQVCPPTSKPCAKMGTWLSCRGLDTQRERTWHVSTIDFDCTLISRCQVQLEKRARKQFLYKMPLNDAQSHIVRWYLLSFWPHILLCFSFRLGVKFLLAFLLALVISFGNFSRETSLNLTTVVVIARDLERREKQVESWSMLEQGPMLVNRICSS